MIARAAMILAVSALLVVGCKDQAMWTHPERSEADVKFETGADRKPTPQTLYSMARILASKGRDSKCQVILTRLLRDHPGFMPAYCDLAELHMRQGRPESAMHVLKKALQIRPIDPIILNNLGMCHLEKKQYSLALRRFMQAASVASPSARYRANMATALGLMGRYKESLSLYLQVLPPSHAHLNLAILCQARDDFDRARQEYQKAAAISQGATPG